MPDTVRVRFTRAYTVQDAEQTHYEADSEHDLSEDSARHFVNRGAAEVIPAKSKPAPDPKPEPDAKPEPAGKAPAKPKSSGKKS